jgi:hypothetical protein
MKKSFLRETSRLLAQTNDNLSYAISELRGNDTSLLKDIHETLENIDVLLRCEADGREALEIAHKKEMWLKNQAYFFILDSGNLDAFREYIKENPKEF